MKVEITCPYKKAAYNQRFVVSEAKKGNGIHVNKGAKTQVESKEDWLLNIQNDKGTGKKEWMILY